jgi:hypothetical protein
MSSDISELIGAEVERSFAGEPAMRDAREYAARGRRVQRRRRAAIGAAGVVAVAGASTLILGGTHVAGTVDRGAEPATPGPSRIAASLIVDPEQAERCAAGALGVCDEEIGPDDLHFSDHGTLLRGYEYDEVSDYRFDVIPRTADESAAVELTVNGRTVWVLVMLEHGSASSGMEYAAPDPDRTFDQWVDDGLRTGRWFDYAPDPDRGGHRRTDR